MNRARFLATLLCAAAAASCDKNAVQVLPAGTLLDSRVKFFHFALNGPTVNFFAGTTKMTAVTTTTAGLGMGYGSAGNGGAYSTIAGGSYHLTAQISSGADTNLAIAAIDTTIATSKFYSMYLSGFYNTTNKTADVFFLEDNYPAQIDYTVAQVRFVHAIANAAPLTLRAANTITFDTVVVGGPVAYKNGSAFTTLAPGVYNVYARYTDSTANKISRAAVSFLAGGVYTIGARGDITITSTTATNRPILDNTANR